MNCMLSLLKRKQELKDILVKESKVGNNLYDQLKKDLDEIMLLDRTKMLGKEYTLGKNSNPLLEQNQLSGIGNSLGFSTVQTQTILEKYKLMM